MKCIPVVIAIALLTQLIPAARAEDITVATYNVENFRQHFLAHKLSTSRPSWLPRNDPQATEMLDELRSANDKDNWEVSQVILDPKFFPDVLVIQEGCNESDLKFFANRWLQNKYETVMVFPTNTEREQNLEMLVKPGFKVLDRKDQYFKEPDSEMNERGNKLFARGPAFVLIQSPGGYKFWVGTNHQKSKSGNSVDVTKWRNREAKRTHQIIKELEKQGPDDVIFLGDMNDELGIQQYELEGGGDVITNLIGAPEDGITLATKPLADAGQNSYGGYWRTDHRSFIDHVFVTSGMKNQIQKVEVFHNDFTNEASDHFPVLVHLKADPPK
ncbi:MAG TPA: endonuclease/exonuclease/phosphatase family protein [Tepidisphaeraceae bacterium]|jgi:endonuclease/exonuclease/phosphatase family metal-dependent hydrolase